MIIPHPSGQSHGNGQHGSRPHRLAGILLVECLVYISVFAVITGLAFGACIQVITNSRDLRRNAEDIECALKAGERWRADIRSARGRIEMEEHPEGQALRIPQASGTVMYQFSQGAVWRKATNHSQSSLALAAVKNSRMQRDVRERVTAWRWELELQGRQKVVRLMPLFTFAAVPKREEAQ